MRGGHRIFSTGVYDAARERQVRTRNSSRPAYDRSMANPAQLLLTQLLEWNQPNHTAEQARGIGDGANDWTVHRIAARHLDAIAELLTQMGVAGRNVTVFQRYYPAWCRAVFSYPGGWKGPGSGSLDRGALEHLETLADMMVMFVPTVAPDGIEEIKTYAEGIRGLLDEDDSIDELLKLHIRQVIAHLIWCADNYSAVGDFDLREAVERLAASIIRATVASSRKDRWSEWINAWVWPFAINVVAAIPGNALAQLALGG
jgi:hypothetical protein